jgi:hypothetical protein
MVYRGKVKNGTVVLEDRLDLADGTPVEITPAEEAGQTLEEIFRPFIGKATGLPADLSENHDHYLYGVPKRTDI